MLPGLPMMLPKALPPAVPPFDLSGSWEMGFEGWVLTFGSRDIRGPGVPFGEIVIVANSGGRLLATYSLPDGGGLKITAGVSGHTDGPGSWIRLAYRIGGSGWINLATWDNLEGIYAPMGGWFIAPRGQTIDIMIEGNGVDTAADDWSITGVVP